MTYLRSLYFLIHIRLITMWSLAIQCRFLYSYLKYANLHIIHTDFLTTFKRFYVWVTLCTSNPFIALLTETSNHFQQTKYKIMRLCAFSENILCFKTTNFPIPPDLNATCGICTVNLLWVWNCATRLELDKMCSNFCTYVQTYMQYKCSDVVQFTCFLNKFN